MPAKTTLSVGGEVLPLWTSRVLIIGSGAAALNAAVQLYDRGVEDLLLVTEADGGGTSNNSGSDKQTYYKLSVEGAGGDSPVAMARDLARGCMHGDVALVEATLSAQSFFHLVQIGVPFPHHRYGGYVGYKTDHDPAGRATSAGPRTSNQMFQCLRREVERRGIRVLDGQLVIALLRDEGGDRVVGAVSAARADGALTLFHAPQVVLGTGGPGELYLRSVYPEGQLGSLGLALEAGATAQNLTEAQFGLASTKFRWNLSGTYQQVLPRYYSVDEQGAEHDFLTPVFGSPGRTADAIFLKGYQWPFDPKKLAALGSSLIDLLVYRETEVRGRRVFMDFLHNISTDFDLSRCGEETQAYLRKSGAEQALPIERLAHMNQPAIDLYADNGIDLTREPLEIAVCAQHTNGGLTGDLWWQSPLAGLFPVGEVNGSHGVYRPGGSALNSGQCGALRAAQYIAARGRAPGDAEAFARMAARDLDAVRARVALLREHPGDGPAVRHTIQSRMTRCAAHIRSLPEVQKELGPARELYRTLAAGGGAGGDLCESVENLHLALTSWAYLEALQEYLARGGGSRGSALVLADAGEPIHEALPADWRMRPDRPELLESIGEIAFDGEAFSLRRVPVRPVPEEGFWFETVWNEYRAGEVFD